MSASRLRRAEPGDVPAMLDLKQSLRLTPGAQRGGFLLGCSAERYAQLIRHSSAIVLEVGGRLAGLAIALPDAALRSSELWARRSAIAWHSGFAEPPEGEKVAYFDQLALAPWASRLHAAPLALAAVRSLAADHRHLFATTLAEPVSNAAAAPLLRAFGARIVGLVREHYPEVGDVLSWLHHAPMSAGLEAVAGRRDGVRAASAVERLAA